jgi:RNA polymerase sigma-70 factor (ECF subfamily)
VTTNDGAAEATSGSSTDPYSPWLERARTGDQAAVEEILRRLRPAVLRYCLSRVGDRERAEDVTQEVMIGVTTGLAKYEERGLPFQAFAFRIAQRRVADSYRSAGRNPLVPTEDLPEITDLSETPPEIAEARERAAYAHELLARLTPDQREVVLLRVAAGLPAEEVGAIMGRSAVAVRVAQHRALARLRTLANADVAGGRERP